MNKLLNTFIIGFSKECSFPEAITELEKDNIIKICNWVTTNGYGNIDLMDFYHGRYFKNHEIKHQIPSELHNQLLQYLFEFCYINSRTHLSHSYTEGVGSNIYHEVNEFHKFAKVIYDIFITSKIDLVLFQEIPHDGAEIVLYRLAKLMGIKTIILTNFTHFWGRSFAFYSLEDFGDFNEIPNLSDDADQIKIDYQDFKGKIFYMKNVSGYQSKLNFLNKKLRELRNKFLIKSFTKPFVSEVKFNRALSRLVGAGLQYINIKNYKNNFESLLCADVDLKQKYIYFALHLDPEIPTVPPLAGIYHDQLLALERLSNSVPNNVLIYVKENPKQTDIVRSDSFFDRLKKLKNVRLVDRNTYELIDNSCFVATIAGTVGWEALTGGKNVLLFGKTWYQKFPGVFKFSDNIDVEKISNYKIDQNEFEQAVRKLINKSTHGMTYFEFNNRNLTKITDIYPQYTRESNNEYLSSAIKKLIVYNSN